MISTTAMGNTVACPSFTFPIILKREMGFLKHWQLTDHLMNMGSASGRRPDSPAVRAAASLPFDLVLAIGWWVLRMCSSGCPLTCYVYQAALELMTHPPVCLPSASITGMGHYIFLVMCKATDHKTALCG